MITIRKAVPEDLTYYLSLQRESWGEKMAVQEQAAKSRFNCCLDGILIAEEDGQPVGTTTMIRLAGYDFENPLSWNAATGDGWCDTHQPNGPICFGVDLSVSKGFGDSAVDVLMVGCMQLVILAGTKYCILGGRMPGFRRYRDKNPDADPEQYMWAKTRSGRYLDPQVNMYAHVPGLKIVKLIPEYFDDPESLDYGVLLRWSNPFHRLPGRRFWAQFPMWAFRAEAWGAPRLKRLRSRFTSLRRKLGRV